MSIIQTIAMLCQIHAGDTHQYGSTVNEIVYEQMACHAFYAKCSHDKDISVCMIQRKQQFDADRAKELEKHR